MGEHDSATREPEHPYNVGSYVLQLYLSLTVIVVVNLVPERLKTPRK